MKRERRGPLLCAVLLFYIFCCSRGYGAPALSTITFVSEPSKAAIYAETVDLSEIGLSGEPITMDFSAFKSRGIITIVREGKKVGEINVSRLASKDSVQFTFRKEGYNEKTVAMPIAYLRDRTRYPDLKKYEMPVMLDPVMCNVLFRTDPPKADIYVQYYSVPGELPREGRADMAQKPVTLNLSRFSSSGDTCIYFRHRYYKEHVEKIRMLNFSPSRLNYYPPKGKIRLEPQIPVISPILFNFTYRPLTASAVFMAVIILLSLAVKYLLLPPLARHREKLDKIKKWEALTRRVDREDPMYNRLIGNYRIIEKIGAGGMATVYRAVPEETLNDEDSVAIKIMQVDKAENEEFTERFKREIRISSSLNHPHILRILDYGDEEGLLYIVMELIRGKTLRRIIPAEGFSAEQFHAYYKPILQALIYAHKDGILHRDLKPDNIMVTDQDRIVVMDFGLARRQDGSMITASGVAIGTPAYMSPEQVSGKSLDTRTDQYSLGVMAFQMLTGQLPFYDENTINIMFKHLTDAPPPLREFRGDMPEAMEKMILRMLEKEPDGRFPNLAEVLYTLEEITRKIRYSR